MTTQEYQRKWRKEHPEKCESYVQKYRAKNPEKVKQWVKARNANPKHKARQKAWAKANPDSNKAAVEKYRKSHPERLVEAALRWRIKNPEYLRMYERNRSRTDPIYRLKKALRCRLWSAIRNQLTQKSATTMDLVGCDGEFLRNYLEQRFQPGMTWDNYGSFWEVDHRIPCAEFDLTIKEQQAACFHYSNLRPLAKSENRKKWRRLPGAHQAELI